MAKTDSFALKYHTILCFVLFTCICLFGVCVCVCVLHVTVHTWRPEANLQELSLTLYHVERPGIELWPLGLAASPIHTEPSWWPNSVACEKTKQEEVGVG